MRVIIYLYILFSAGAHSNANVLLSCDSKPMQTAHEILAQTSEDGTRYICICTQVPSTNMHSVSSDHHQALERFTIIISYLNLIARLARLFDFIVNLTTITSTGKPMRSANKKSKQSIAAAHCLTVLTLALRHMSMAFSFRLSQLLKDWRIRFDNHRLYERIYKIQFLRHIVVDSDVLQSESN